MAANFHWFDFLSLSILTVLCPRRQGQGSVLFPNSFTLPIDDWMTLLIFYSTNKSIFSLQVLIFLPFYARKVKNNWVITRLNLGPLALSLTWALGLPKLYLHVFWVDWNPTIWFLGQKVAGIEPLASHADACSTTKTRFIKVFWSNQFFSLVIISLSSWRQFLSAAIGQRPRNYLSCCSCSCSPFGSFPH